MNKLLSLIIAVTITVLPACAEPNKKLIKTMENHRSMALKVLTDFANLEESMSEKDMNELTEEQARSLALYGDRLVQNAILTDMMVGVVGGAIELQETKDILEGKPSNGNK